MPDRRSTPLGPARVPLLILAALATAAPGTAAVADAPGRAVDDFRYAVELFDAGKEPLGKAEIVFRQGTFYLFFSGAKREVAVIEPTPTLRVTLIDLRRNTQTYVTGAELDAHIVRLRKALEAAARSRETSEERNDRLAAAMARNLFEPNFEETFDPEAGRLLLKNASVTIEATGEPDPDPDRRALLEVALTTLTRLSSMRVPDDLPPFPTLDAQKRLIGERHLRPREVSIVVRLTGPPQKVRRVYEFVPELTDREREAIRRVDGLRVTAALVPFNDYEAEE